MLMDEDRLLNYFHSVNVHGGDVNGVSFHNHLLASGSADKSVRLFDTTNFTEVSFSPLMCHTYNVHGVKFSNDGAQLASYSTDGRCVLWELKSGSIVQTLKHPSESSIRVCCFAPNGHLIATAGDDDLVCLWSISSSQLLRSLESHDESVISLAFSPDSAFLVSGSTGGDLRVWDAVYGHGRPLALEIEGHDLGVTCAAFSPSYGSAAGGVDRSRASQVHFLLATGGFDNNLKLWDLLSYSGSPNVELRLRNVLRGHAGPVMTCAFSPDGTLLASGGGDKSIRLWCPLKGRAMFSIDAHNRYVTCCAFSSDGTMLASGSNDRTIKLWRVESKTGVAVNGIDVLVDLSEEPKVSGSGSDRKRKVVSQWTVEDVCLWSREIGMGQYEAAFRRNEIDGAELLGLNDSTLASSIGITALGHRNKILRAIRSIHQHPAGLTRSGEDGAPDEYLCPITREVMFDPVIAADGYTYERKAIAAWMDSGKTLSPMTNGILSSTELTPNRSLKMLIQRHQQAQ